MNNTEENVEQFLDDEIIEESSQQKYINPKDEKVIVDAATGEVSEKLGPWETILLIGKQLNMTILKPKKNCKKCNEQGYCGVETKTGMPIPCMCIFTPEQRLKSTQFMMRNSPNRATRRRAGAFN